MPLEQEEMTEILGTPKDDFLASVREALGRSTPFSPSPPYFRLEESLTDLVEMEQDLRKRLSADHDLRINALVESARATAWNVNRFANMEEARSHIAKLLNTLGVQHAVRSNQPIFHQFPIDDLLNDLSIESTVINQSGASQLSHTQARQKMINADIGITGSDYCVVETGSVVILPRAGLSRLVSLGPPIHLAIVNPEEIVDTLDDVFLLRRIDYLRNGGDMGSYLNFISGPSRTADIEQTLVVGVHGPKEVHMVILG